LFRDELEIHFLQGKDYRKGGRSPYDYVLDSGILPPSASPPDATF